MERPCAKLPPFSTCQQVRYTKHIIGLRIGLIQAFGYPQFRFALLFGFAILTVGSLKQNIEIEKGILYHYFFVVYTLICTEGVGGSSPLASTI